LKSILKIHAENDLNGECFSYNEIGTWRVEALKEYLQRRDLRVSGRKKEMFATAEQNFSPVCMDTDVLWFKHNAKKKVF